MDNLLRFGNGRKITPKDQRRNQTHGPDVARRAAGAGAPQGGDVERSLWFLTFHEDDPESLEWKAFKLKEAKPELRVFVYVAHEEEETIRFAYRELVDVIVPEPEI